MLRRLVPVFALIWPALLVPVDPVLAAEAVAQSGRVLRIGAAIFTLEGIDGPEVDQICIDQHADVWTCGIDARNRLAALVKGRDVRCEDRGPDPAARNRRVAICTIAGDTISLNQSLVRSGMAVADGSARFKADQDEARVKQAGLWAGCFVLPADFRKWRQDAALIGSSCRPENAAAIRLALFPEEPVMPPGCSVKGIYSTRARLTGFTGIYHTQACRSYATVNRPQRWFCSEEDARAANFRRAFNCRPRKSAEGSGTRATSPTQ